MPSVQGTAQLTVWRSAPFEDTSLVSYDCPRCGVFSAGEPSSLEDIGMRSLADDHRRVLSGLIREATDNPNLGRYPGRIIPTDIEDIIASGPLWMPVPEQLDAFLRAVAERINYLHESSSVDFVGVWAARLFLPATGREAFDRIRQEAEARKLIESPTKQQNQREGYRLTMKGWERVAQLQAEPRKGDQAFVAMWFHEDMDTIYDDGIAPALQALGYRPLHMGKVHHDNRIDAEIEAQIKRSRLLVADLTGHRGGVYYEAGLARGQGIPVVWTCNESFRPFLAVDGVTPEMDEVPAHEQMAWTKQIHFDTRQYQILMWSDAEDLRDQLIAHVWKRGHFLVDPFPDRREAE